MEQHWLWYLTGAFDTAGTITMRIRNDESLQVDYRMRPALIFSRPIGQESLFGMFDEYTEEFNIQYRMDEQNDSIRFMVEDPVSVRRFLEPIYEGLIQQRKRAEVMLDEVLPKYDNKNPGEKETVLEIMEAVEEMRQYPHKNRESKFTLEYFEDEWGMTHSQ